MSDIDTSSLNIHQNDRHGIPLNAEVKGDELIQEFITPTEKIFHRNHDDLVQIPVTNSNEVEEEWRMSITLDEDMQKDENIQFVNIRSQATSEPSILIPYGDLLHVKGTCEGMKRLSTTATLECAGNRREDLSDDQEKTEGIQWSSGAISTAYWSGISIRDLLIRLGIRDPYEHHRSNLHALQPSELDMKKDCANWASDLHLHMLSAQPTSESDQPTGEYFGASIPLSVAMHPQQQCILATHQNDQILTQSHGFPIRAVVPGHVGARWVKWLRGLRISCQPEDSPPMRLDYKLLSPPRGADEEKQKEWKKKISGEEKDENFRKNELNKQDPIQTLGVGSAIEKPKNDSILSRNSDKIHVQGYAVGQDGSPITKVEVIILDQNNKEETSSSLRDRAENCEQNQWILAELLADPSAERRNESVDWAWTLWQVQVPLPSIANETCFALVARASKCSFENFLVCRRPNHESLLPFTATSSGIVQVKESDWNLRGFSTRSWPVIRGLKVEIV